MLVDDIIVNEEILHHEPSGVDQRGIALYFYAKENGIMNRFEDFQFESSQIKSEIRFKYYFIWDNFDQN
jgi:hypothetical protein